MEKILRTIQKIIPKKVYSFFQPFYHLTLSYIAAIYYKFPAKDLKVILVTGTKGKSTTTEIIYEILKSAGKNVSVSNTINTRIFSYGKEEIVPNLYKMSTPGRFFLQRFLKDAFKNNCEYVVLEITSQAVLQFRHLFLFPNFFVFTNLSPEHIESHGNFENYANSKVKIAEQVFKSSKDRKKVILNQDDENHKRFLSTTGTVLYSKKDVNNLAIFERGISFDYKNVHFTSPLKGEFNFYNILSAIKLCEAIGVDLENIKNAIEKIEVIKGRVEFVKAGQNFDVIVDYAHTPDSLEKLYKAFPGKNKISVIGGTGGGRDSWKREKMGEIADQYCKTIILTDEDSYDEDLDKILNNIKQGIKGKTEGQNLFIIKDRKQAIKKAIEIAQQNDVVFISGKGTDPYIMGKNNSKIPWSDYNIAKELLENIVR